MNKGNNKNIISIISIIVVLVICFFGYNFYQKKQAEIISAEKLTALHELTKKFNDENDRNKKFNLLKDTLDEQSKYNLDSYKVSKVQDEFKNSINNMRTYFHNDYDNTIKENNITDINNTSDESRITDKKSKLDNLIKTIGKEQDITFETEQQAQEKKSEVEKLLKKYEDRISELKKETDEKKKEKTKSSSDDIGEQPVNMTSTHYENEYFIVDVPAKWSGKWYISKITDTKNLGTPSQPAIMYSFSRRGDNPMFGNGGQTVHVYPNGLPNKANYVKDWTKFGSNIYVGAGASSGFFNEKNESYRNEMAKIRAK